MKKAQNTTTQTNYVSGAHSDERHPTSVIRVEYFKDSNNNVHGFDVMPVNEHNQVNIPDDFIHITKEDALLITNPPQTKIQLIEQAEAKKQFLIAEVHAETQILQTKLSLKRIKPVELELLNAWLDYLDELEAIDTSAAPDIEWQQKPQ